MDVAGVSQIESVGKENLNAGYLTASIRVSPALARRICRVRERLRKVDPRQVYSASSHLHVTVKVLGVLGKDVMTEDLDKILGIVRGTAMEQRPFELAVEGVGVFPDVIYGKVGVGAADVRRMNSKLVKRLGDMAVTSKFDGRGMLPHVTMAHFATTDVGPLLAKAAKLANEFVGSMTVSSIEVKEFRPNTSVNSPVARFKLGVG